MKFYLNLKILIMIAAAKHIASETRQISQSYRWKKPLYFYEGSTRLATFYAMFTHQVLQIHQQYPNYTVYGQILKEILLFEPHVLKFDKNFPSLEAKAVWTEANKVKERPAVVDSNP